MNIRCSGPSRVRYRTAVLGLPLLFIQNCLAAHWEELGPSAGSPAGIAYMDLDSLRVDGEYRVAVFLTIYDQAIPNSHRIKLDRIVQETAFDCTKHAYSLLSTAGYFAGEEVGKSSSRGDWRDRFNGAPPDPASQRAFDLVCSSPIAIHPEVTAPQDLPAVVTFPKRD